MYIEYTILHTYNILPISEHNVSIDIFDTRNITQEILRKVEWLIANKAKNIQGPGIESEFSP